MSIITAQDLAAYLRIDDVDDDVLLGISAASGSQWVRKTCGRTFEVTTSGSESSRDFYPKTASLVVTDDFATATNLTVKIDSGDDGTYETTLTISTDYFLEPLNGFEDGLTVPYRRIVGSSTLFPHCATRPAVRVAARWGWVAVPDDVKQAALIEAARLFKRRTSPEGFAAGFAEYGARITSRADPDAMDLLDPYIRSEQVFYT